MRSLRLNFKFNDRLFLIFNSKTKVSSSFSYTSKGHDHNFKKSTRTQVRQ